VPSGPLTYASSSVSDAAGTALLKLQYGSNIPGGAWAKVNVVLDVQGSPSATLVADTITLAVAGGPQPVLGPVLVAANQNLSVQVTGAQPNTTIVAHVSGLWSTSMAELHAVTSLGNGSIGAQQIVGTPFLEASSIAVAGGGTYTSSIFPMLGYAGVLVQFIASGVSTMPTVVVQWLDSSTPPNQLFQSNWQAQKIIDWVQAWGQQLQVQVTNNDASPLSIALTVVPLAVPPGRKADSLTYKQTALNEIVSIRGVACGVGNTIQATTAAGLGWGGPATVFLSTNWPTSDLAPNYLSEIAYGPTGTGKVLWRAGAWAPEILGMPIDLPDQPITLLFTNNGTQAVTPAFSVVAGYR
jgi:hypothetical protein